MTTQVARRFAGILAGASIFVAACCFTPTVQATEVSDPSNITVATFDATQGQQPARHPRENSYLKRKWGVEVVFVREVAAGYMLEFRYKVLDADKAGPLFKRQTKPMLIHVDSGAKFVVPTPAKTGALRNSNPPKAGQTYWMFFANPNKIVKSGDLVNLQIGEFAVEGIVVR